MKYKLIIFILSCFLGLSAVNAQKSDAKKNAIINAIQSNKTLSPSFKKMAVRGFVTKIGQDSLLIFEKAIKSGQGKAVLPKELVETAKKKFPGDSEYAIRERFKIYMKHMERVHEDE